MLGFTGSMRAAQATTFGRFQDQLRGHVCRSIVSKCVMSFCVLNGNWLIDWLLQLASRQPLAAPTETAAAQGLAQVRREDTILSDPFLNTKQFWQCSRYFDFNELFPVYFGEQVNQVEKISHVHHSHPELFMGNRVEHLLEVHKAHIEWWLLLACLVHQ